LDAVKEAFLTVNSILIERTKRREERGREERERDGELCNIHYLFGYYKVYINNMYRTLLCK